MAYRYGQPVKRDKRSIKKYIVGGVASILVAGGMAIPAFAASGDYCGSSANGCAAADAAGAQCGSGAASGSFGAFGGKYNNFGQMTYPGDPGANGPATGAANSAVCGNPQGNP